jgi:hypothetical protein
LDDGKACAALHCLAHTHILLVLPGNTSCVGSVFDGAVEGLVRWDVLCGRQGQLPQAHVAGVDNTGLQLNIGICKTPAGMANVS